MAPEEDDTGITVTQRVCVAAADENFAAGLIADPANLAGSPVMIFGGY